MQLTAHFSLEELTASDYATRHGISNVPTGEALDNLHTLASGLERVRSVLGNKPMHSLSGYRCPKLNSALRGAKDSQHMKGLADDFVCPEFGTPREVADELAASWNVVQYDQLIWEGTWVHISFSADGEEPRGEVLTAHFANGGVTYTRGLD